MFIRMIRGALFRQRGKMLLIAFTIALGTSLAILPCCPICMTWRTMGM